MKSRDNGIYLENSKKPCRFNFGLDENYENVYYDEHIQQCCDEKDYQYLKPKNENNGMCFGEKGSLNRKSEFGKIKKNVLSRYIRDDKNKNMKKNNFSIQNDPTKNVYYEWIRKNYDNQVDNQNLLDELYLLSQIKSNPDIDNYFENLPLEKEKFYDFKSKLNNLDSETSGKEFLVLYDGVYGNLTIPLTESASCEFGKGTKWCTSGIERNMFNHYNEDGPLFIWKDRRIYKDNKFQFHFPSFSFMDSGNKPIKENIFYYLLEVPVLNELFSVMLVKSNIVVKFAVNFLNIHSKEQFDNYFNEYLLHIYNNSYEMLYYRVYMIQQKDGKLEKLLLNSTKENLGVAVDYAFYVLKNRWFELEEKLFKAGYTEFLMNYTINVIGDRWNDLEEYLLLNCDIYSAIDYIQKIIKDRWVELEEKLLNSEDINSCIEYTKQIIKGRWVELEEKLLENENIDDCIEYTKQIIKGRWDELENKLIENNNLFNQIEYAKYVIKGRWVELEEKLIENGDKHKYRLYMSSIKNI